MMILTFQAETLTIETKIPSLKEISLRMSQYKIGMVKLVPKTSKLYLKMFNSNNFNKYLNIPHKTSEIKI